MKWILLWLFVAAFDLSANGPPMDLIHPKIKITLLSRSRVSPTRAVLVDNVLYYATRSVVAKCPSEASDLYAYSLSEKKERKILSIPCIERIDTDGKNIYILHHTNENEPSYTKLESNDIKPVLSDEANALLEARMTMKMHQEEVTEEGKVFPFFFANGDRLLVVKSITPSEGAPVYLSDLFRLDNQKPVNPTTGSVALKLGAGKAIIWECQNLSFLGDHITLAISEVRDQFSQIVVLSAVDGKLIRTVGGTNPLPKNWGDKPVPAERWAVRKPSFLLAIPGGFFVADRTAWTTEARAVSYFSEKEGLFYRVGIFSKHLEGLSYTLGGLVVSYPNEGEVAWFGTTNPFSNETVRSEDVVPNPYLLQRRD